MLDYVLDFDVLIKCLFCLSSMKTVENSLKYLDINYFLGKVCFVVLNGRLYTFLLSYLYFWSF